EADQLERSQRPPARGARAQLAQERPDHDVVEDGHFLEHLHDLEGAGDAPAGDGLRRAVGQIKAGEDDAPRVDPQLAGQAVEEGGVARAVRSDEAYDLAFVEAEV